jgi:putative flippase GtrA
VHTTLSRIRQACTAEVISFLMVGGAGYVVDVAVFNWLLSIHPFASWDPSIARVLAVLAATVVTYVGNRSFTWTGSSDRRGREVTLFAVFNAIGLAISVLTLVVSHDVLGLTSRLADNLAANVVGLALGTAFRFWSYRTFVFADPQIGAGAHSSSFSRRTAIDSAAEPTAYRPQPSRSRG